MDDRVGVWHGKEFRPGDVDLFPNKIGVEVLCRVTGIGDDGTVYVKRVEDDE